MLCAFETALFLQYAISLPVIIIEWCGSGWHLSADLSPLYLPTAHLNHPTAPSHPSSALLHKLISATHMKNNLSQLWTYLQLMARALGYRRIRCDKTIYFLADFESVTSWNHLRNHRISRCDHLNEAQLPPRWPRVNPFWTLFWSKSNQGKPAKQTHYL